MPMPLDSDALVPAIADGDTAAFGQWIAAVEGRLWRSLRGFAAQVDVESVVQETLLRVWQVAPRFVRDARPDGLLRLAFRIARNLAVSETRRLRTRPAGGADSELDLDQFAATGHGLLPDAELVAAIAACRQQLPRQPGAALAARLDDAGRAPDQTLAQRLGMRLNTFLQNITRARRLLAECLRRRGLDLGAGLS